MTLREWGLGGIRQLGNLGEAPDANGCVLRSSLHTAHPYYAQALPKTRRAKERTSGGQSTWIANSIQESIQETMHKDSGKTTGENHAGCQEPCESTEDETQQNAGYYY